MKTAMFSRPRERKENAALNAEEGELSGLESSKRVGEYEERTWEKVQEGAKCRTCSDKGRECLTRI